MPDEETKPETTDKNPQKSTMLIGGKEYPIDLAGNVFPPGHKPNLTESKLIEQAINILMSDLPLAEKLDEMTAWWVEAKNFTRSQPKA